MAARFMISHWEESEQLPDPASVHEGMVIHHGDVFKQALGGEWQAVGVGPPGEAGAPGATILSGTGAPTSATGVAGDWYIDTNTFVMYGPKGSDLTWPPGTALKAPVLNKDVAWIPLTAPSSADEFNDYTFTGWTAAVPTGTATWIEKADVLSAKFSGISVNDIACQLRPITIPVGGYIETAVRLASITTVTAVAGLVLTNGILTSSSAATSYVQVPTLSNFGSVVTGIHTGTVTSSTTYSGNTITSYSPWLHIRLRWVSANTFRQEISVDGVSWSTFSITDVPFTMTPTHVGLFVSNWGTGGEALASFEYFRSYNA